MSIFSIFKIFRKKPAPAEMKLELPPLEKTELGIPKMPEEPKAPEIPKFEPEPAHFEPPQVSYRELPAPQPPKDVSKELEIISAKLDTLRAMIDSLNHRIEAMERKPRW